MLRPVAAATASITCVMSASLKLGVMRWPLALSAGRAGCAGCARPAALPSASKLAVQRTMTTRWIMQAPMTMLWRAALDAAHRLLEIEREGLFAAFATDRDGGATAARERRHDFFAARRAVERHLIDRGE